MADWFPGLGGVVMPIMIRELIEKVGFPWAMRSVAFLMLGLMVIANLTVKSRIPPKGARSWHISDFITPLKDLKYMLTVGGSSFLHPPLLAHPAANLNQASSSSSACSCP